MQTGKPSQLKIYSHNNYLTHGHSLIPCASGTWERRTMSIRKYFKLILPLPSPKDTGLSIHATCEANTFIQQASEEPMLSKKHQYTVYTNDQRPKVGKFVTEHGNAAALKKFKMELPDKKESMVWLFKKTLLQPTTCFSRWYSYCHTLQETRKATYLGWYWSRCPEVH